VIYGRGFFKRAVRNRRTLKLVLPAKMRHLAGTYARGPEDSADVYLIDDRYRTMVRLLPRWFRERVMGTVKLADLPMHLEVKA
jgi:hypothetical protein